MKTKPLWQHKDLKPFYQTERGCAYLQDSLEVLRKMPPNFVNLVFTSPPYALTTKKKYGNVSKDQYSEWFLPFAREILRVLKPDGSFVLNIGNSYNQGEPTRSVYHWKLAVELVEEIGFYLAQETFWYNPSALAVPQEWVTVRRIRLRDSVQQVWWFSKTPHPKADNSRVLRPYSVAMIKLARSGRREQISPSGHYVRGIKAGRNIRLTSTDNRTKPDEFTVSAGGSICPNALPTMLQLANTSATDAYARGCRKAGIAIHPARFPASLPEFFIRFLTDRKDLVVDPFAGSNSTGAISERMDRHWIAVEMNKEYLEGSRFHFKELAGENHRKYSGNQGFRGIVEGI